MNPPQSVHEDDSFRHNSTFVKRLSPGSWPISHRCPRQAGWRPESDPRDRPGRRGSAGNCGDVVEQRAAHRASGRRGRRERSVRAPLRPSRCCGWSPSGPATLSLRRHAAPTPTPMPSMPGTEEVVILATAGPCRPIRLRPAHDATLAKQPNVARDQAGRRPTSGPRFLAICRDLVEHRVGEFALRARADEWAFEGSSVTELMQAPANPAVCLAQWWPRSAPRRPRCTPAHVAQSGSGRRHHARAAGP
jgi:hypothetical protein